MTRHAFNRRQRLLIVDDVPGNLTLLGETFSPDYEVAVATDGERALELTRRDPPDLILLDVVMPGLDGFELCKRLKEDAITQPVPLIFITSKRDPANEELGLSLGAADYIVKPFHLPVVRARVKTHLELKRKNDMLEELAMRDGLTALPNRRAFDHRLKEEWSRCRRHGDVLGCIMLDVDDFKRFNDLYGHRLGDECLRSVTAGLATSLLRSSDFVARYGGEEFVALLPSTTDDGLAQTAERLRAAIEALEIPHARSRAAEVVTLSLGATLCDPGDGGHPLDCVEAADRCLYRAKAQGRNRTVIHCPAADAKQASDRSATAEPQSDVERR